MTIALQITLIFVLLAVAAGLMRLFFQLGRTAKSIDAFLGSAQKDLAQMTEDIHASRLRMDQLLDSLQPSLDEFSVFARTVGRVGHAVNEFQIKFQCGFESASRNIGSLLGLLGPVLAIFKSHKQPQQEEPRRKS